mmetsp:Transcript_75894/g.210644  ORF Transcript_75894/g.210644 Transcript_75894/m.210644 type:complete len:131 (+) Transcript_75894:1095-1487(+)
MTTTDTIQGAPTKTNAFAPSLSVCPCQGRTLQRRAACRGGATPVPPLQRRRPLHTSSHCIRLRIKHRSLALERPLWLRGTMLQARMLPGCTPTVLLVPLALPPRWATTALLGYPDSLVRKIALGSDGLWH